MASGYARLYRKAIKSDVFHDDHLWKLWCYCIMRANHEARIVRIPTGRGLKSVHVERGQFMFGRNSAATHLGWTSSNVRNRLKRLRELGCVDTQADTHWTVVTVCNYELYNPSPRSKGQAKDRQQDTQQDRQEDTNKHSSKHQLEHQSEKSFVRSGERTPPTRLQYHEAFEIWWKAYPVKIGKKSAYAAWQRAGKGIKLATGCTKEVAAAKLQSACEAFAASPKGRGKFVPHPSSWLNQGRWDDDPAAWQDSGDRPEKSRAVMPWEPGFEESRA